MLIVLRAVANILLVIAAIGMILGGGAFIYGTALAISGALYIRDHIQSTNGGEIVMLAYLAAVAMGLVIFLASLGTMLILNFLKTFIKDPRPRDFY